VWSTGARILVSTFSSGEVSALRSDRFTSGEPLTGRLCVPQCRRKDKSLPAVCIRTLAPRMSSSIAVITSYLLFLCPVHRLPCDVRKSSIRNPGHRFVCSPDFSHFSALPSAGANKLLYWEGLDVRAPFCGLVPVRLTAVVAKAAVSRAELGLAYIYAVSLEAEPKRLRETNTNEET